MGTRLSKAYLLTKVLTANNQEVIGYLYEGIIGYLHRAKSALEEDRRADAGMAINRAIGILIELSGSLNYATGGQLAFKLDAIYSYLIESLALANGRADLEALESCEGITSILCDAWQQAASMQHQAPSPRQQQLQILA